MLAAVKNHHELGWALYTRPKVSPLACLLSYDTVIHLPSIFLSGKQIARHLESGSRAFCGRARSELLEELVKKPETAPKVRENSRGNVAVSYHA